MKKVFSLLLAVLMLVSALPVAYAAETADYTVGTHVVYTAANNEDYTITVPAALAPGGSGTVTLSGTWADNRIVTVTADPTVTLTNSIKSTDTKTLDVNFAGISEKGSNTAAQTFTEDVSVAGIDNAIFGTWIGKFNYNVELAELPIIGYSYNGVILPELPQDIDYNEYSCAGISELNGMYMLTLSTSTPIYTYANNATVVFNGFCAQFTGYATYWESSDTGVINKNYVINNGEWLHYSLDTHDPNRKTWGVINVGEEWQAPIPIWVNQTLYNEDGMVYLLASEPVPVYE